MTFGKPISKIIILTHLIILYLAVLSSCLTVSLGLEVRGQVITGLPCITRFNQLFCRSGGQTYPTQEIKGFIDDNKALIRRMYGSSFVDLDIDFGSIRRKRSLYEGATDDLGVNQTRSSLENEIQLNFILRDANKTHGDDNPYVNVFKRIKRQTRGRGRSSPGPLPLSEKNRVDVCGSKEEVATPFWASNSRGKILAIVNTREFSQIIHQEVCESSSTHRCSGDCGCEQKYKYHRLMAYDPDNECKGIYMDWFLFPSCCSCRCDPL